MCGGARRLPVRGDREGSGVCHDSREAHRALDPFPKPLVKSLGVVALALLCLGLFAFAVRNVLTTSREWQGWEQDTTRLFTAIEVERIVRDSNKALLNENARLTDSLSAIANRHSVRRTTALREADSLKALLEGGVSERDSLLYALEMAERLEGALGEATGEIVGLRSIVAAQGLSLSRLKLSEQQAWSLLDSASAVIRRVPRGCRIVVIPCPTVSGGYGATLSEGRLHTGPTMNAGWEIRF